MLKRIKKLIRRRRGSAYKKLLVAAVLAISFYLGVNSHIIALADIPLIGNILEEYVHSSKRAIADYKTVVGQTATDNGISVRLNEVLIDDGQIIISSTFRTENMVWDDQAMPRVQVYVNDQELPGGGSFTKKIVDEHTQTYFSSINAGDLDLKGDLIIKIVYSQIDIWSRDESRKPPVGAPPGAVCLKNMPIKGNWTFIFKASGANLLAETKTIPLNRVVKFANGQEVTIREVILSPVSTTVNYSINEERIGSFAIIDVTDQNNNQIRQYNSSNSSREGVSFYCRCEPIGKETTMLKISPGIIISRYKESDEAQQTEDPIEVADCIGIVVELPVESGANSSIDVSQGEPNDVLQGETIEVDLQ